MEIHAVSLNGLLMEDLLISTSRLDQQLDQPQQSYLIDPRVALS